MTKMLLIYNPNAGKGQSRRNLSQILERFRKRGYEITVFPTGGHGDAAAVAYEKASEYGLIVCSGGDGTLNEVTDGLMRRKEAGGSVPTLGYIPAGTVNDFASSLEIPKDADGAVSVILDGMDFATDFGSIHDARDELLGHFTYVAGFGAFTEVSYETPQSIKNLIGKAAYFLEGVKRLADIRPFSMKVSFIEDGRPEEIEGQFLFGIVTNSKSVGGFKGLTGREVCLDDGKFDVILIRQPKNAADLQNIVNSLITREMRNTSSICYFHTEQVHFLCEEELPWVLDGESGGIHRELTIRNHRRALVIRVPAKGPLLPEG